MAEQLENIQTALFDLDGTLADTHGLIMKCYDFAVREHLGRPGVPSIWRDRVGLPLDEILLATYAHYNEPAPDEEALNVVKQTYRSHMRDNDAQITAFAGVIELLQSLRALGVRLGVVTTKHTAMAMRHLERLSALSYFEPGGIVCGDMCSAYKPSPEPFRLALAQLKASPSRTFMAGDSPHDIVGARGAGITSVAACWGTDSRAVLLAARPDFVAETPAELLEIIQSGRGR